MKRSFLVLALAASLLVMVLQPALPGAAADWEVYFSPKGGCTQAIVGEVGKAKSTLLVQAYSFTSSPIARAVTEAQARGVKVQVILDESGNVGKDQKPLKYSAIKILIAAGVPTWIDTVHAIAHNKIMIIDGGTVLTGSFNFTKNAEEDNAENLLIIHDKPLAGKYTANWQKHLGHSKAYVLPSP